MTQLPLDPNSHKAEMLRALAALNVATSESEATSLHGTRIDDEDDVLRLCAIRESKPEAFTKSFCDFLTQNPTIFHAVDYFKTKLHRLGFEEVSAIPYRFSRFKLTQTARHSRFLCRQGTTRRQVLGYTKRKFPHRFYRRQGVQARKRRRHDWWPHRCPHREAQAREHEA